MYHDTIYRLEILALRVKNSGIPYRERKPITEWLGVVKKALRKVDAADMNEEDWMFWANLQVLDETLATKPEFATAVVASLREKWLREADRVEWMGRV
jgi:hypothetical protein